MSGETIITVCGNLTADPELRYTQAGVPVANFTIASTPRTFDRNSNEWKDGDTLFLRSTVWKQQAEHVAQSLSKGMRVIAQGRLRQRTFETQQGEKRTTIELEVEDIGPALRNATATVQRVQGQNIPVSPSPAASGAPFGAGPGGNTIPAVSTPQSAAQTTWGAPGATYNDETPF